MIYNRYNIAELEIKLRYKQDGSNYRLFNDISYWESQFNWIIYDFNKRKDIR